MFQEDHGLSLNKLLQRAEIEWHGIKLNQPDWTDHSHSLAFTVQGRDEVFHLIFNAFREALEFEIPPPPADSQSTWRRIIDTYLESPDDICGMAQATPVEHSTYLVQPHSVVVLARDLKQ